MGVSFFPCSGYTVTNDLLDTAMMFWSKLLTEHFRNSPFCEPPADLLSRNFHREIETVVKFSQRVSSEPSTSQRDLQKVLLLGLADTKVGLYSIFHDNVVYRLGYASEEAIRMAYMYVDSITTKIV